MILNHIFISKKNNFHTISLILHGSKPQLKSPHFKSVKETLIIEFDTCEKRGQIALVQSTHEYYFEYTKGMLAERQTHPSKG